MKVRTLITIVVILSVTPLVSLDRARFMELNKKSSEQSKQHDWKGLRATLIEIGREMPAPTPTYFLRMASVETHLGNKAEAIRWMEKYAAVGLKYNVGEDDDLKPLLNDAAFAPVMRKMAARSKPVEKAETVCELPLPELLPEDLAFDKSSERFVVSSIQHHTLYRVTLPKAGATECALEEVPLESDAKRWPVSAVAADAKRNLLWMTANAIPNFAGAPKEDQGKAALLAVDNTTGKTVRRFDLAGPAVLGDMSLAGDGTVYVTDSLGGGVYRVRGELKSATLEKIAGDLFSPQTPALAADGHRLFVADYSMGIAIVDLAQRTQSSRLNYLAHAENIAVTGLDGLILAGDSLVGIQNGTDPERIMRFHLNQAQTQIMSAEVIEQSTERLGEPTHAIAVDGWIYVTANVGWNKVDDHGQLKPGEHFTAPVLLRFK